MYTAAWRVNRRASSPFPTLHIAFPRVIDAPLSKSVEGCVIFARHRYMPPVRPVPTNQIPLLRTREREEGAIIAWAAAGESGHYLSAQRAVSSGMKDVCNNRVG